MSGGAWFAQNLCGYVAEPIEFDSLGDANDWVAKQQHPDDWEIVGPEFLAQRGKKVGE